jgi:uncharacterized Zn finger protein
MSMPLPDDEWLRSEAGDGAFARGKDYAHDGLVELSQLTDSMLRGEAHGTETYRLRVEYQGGDWDWHCDCPAADGGVFCKHLVAAVLTARDNVGENDTEPTPRPATRRGRAAEPVNLLKFLQAQPAQRLADWLHALALEYRDVERQLLLRHAATQPGVLKDALAKALATGSFLDYRRTLDYAARLDPAIEQLRSTLARDPDECRTLCEYALKRLLKIIERCDDSSGSLGERMQDIADLHAQACDAAPPGKPLAKTLHALQQLDDWGMLPLSNYWDALGAQGQADYGKRVMDEYAALPTPKSGTYDINGGATCLRVEALARCTNDFDLLQQVLRRDLSSGYQHLRVLESLREFGRGREALAWAEAAVKRFPDEGRLRSVLAECLAEAGMHDEALEQEWLQFQQHSVAPYWDALKKRAGKTWPAWRERALAAVTKREKGHVSLRVELLLHDGDADTAIGLARDNPVQPHVLLKLASRTKRRDPGTAGAFYLRVARHQAEHLNSARDYKPLVDHLAQASKLLPPSAWRPLLTEVRARHGRKPKLMGMLDKAGL